MFAVAALEPSGNGRAKFEDDERGVPQDLLSGRGGTGLPQA